ncbi:MAG TPA: ubiquitin-like protein Pup, partial [Acidimicrobiales bacterium]|nr:ubiquitin-like protein Pup [Acidimicrobiales bacterium]
MTEREQKRRQTPSQPDETVEDLPPASKQGDKLKAELDELLDDIDEVLEENAEDFV